MGSQAAIKALRSYQINFKLVWECFNRLNTPVLLNKVWKLWLPGYFGLKGNEVADELLRKGRARGSEMFLFSEFHFYFDHFQPPWSWQHHVINSLFFHGYKNRSKLNTDFDHHRRRNNKRESAFAQITCKTVFGNWNRLCWLPTTLHVDCFRLLFPTL